ncbi:hypothetical protein BRC85_03585 [Halobacteriales archaeon QS_1_69_70]|nr:MAG: hypothetical protein BRC85_03585 [Halobacteriales archaeon QS_1_69_70]
MTGHDSRPDDADGDPDHVGGFRFPMADGGDDDAGERHDGSPGTNTGFPDAGADAQPDADGGADVGHPEFGGFDFAAWLDETEDRTPSTVEASAETTAEPERERDVGPAFGGFDFLQWMRSDDVEGPTPPPETARVVSPSIDEVDPEAAARSESAAVSGAAGGAAQTGFAFAEWLAAGDTEFVDPEALMAEPEPTPPSAGASVPGDPGYPAPPGGSVADFPPVKVAMFAVFAASLAAVALTVAGPAAPLGPATGFANPSPAGGAGAPAGTASPTATAAPTPTDTAPPTATDTPEQTDTPTATATQTPTPTLTPTPAANGTATPTQAPNQTETYNGTVIPG